MSERVKTSRGLLVQARRDGLVVREHPWSHAAKVATLARGQEVVAVGFPEDVRQVLGKRNRWVEVKYADDGATGYAPAYYLVEVGEVEPEFGEAELFLKTVDGTFVYSRPDSTSEEIQVLVPGIFVQALGNAQEVLDRLGVEGEWVEVGINPGVYGFAEAPNLAPIEQGIDEVPILCSLLKIEGEKPVLKVIYEKPDPESAKILEICGLIDTLDLYDPEPETALSFLGDEAVWFRVGLPDSLRSSLGDTGYVTAVDVVVGYGYPEFFGGENSGGVEQEAGGEREQTVVDENLTKTRRRARQNGRPSEPGVRRFAGEERQAAQTREQAVPPVTEGEGSSFGPIGADDTPTVGTLYSQVGVLVDSWGELVEGFGGKAGAFWEAYSSSRSNRDTPGVRLYRSRLRSGGVGRSMEFNTFNGATVAVYCAQQGQDLYISWRAFIKAKISDVRVWAHVGASALVAWFAISGVNDFQSSLLGYGGVGGFRSIPFFNPLSLAVVGFVAVLFFLPPIIWGFLNREGDIAAFWRLPVNELYFDEVVALTKVVHNSIILAAVSVGIDEKKLLPRTPYYQQRHKPRI